MSKEAKVNMLPPDGKESFVIVMGSGRSITVSKNGGKGTPIPSSFVKAAARSACIQVGASLVEEVANTKTEAQRMEEAIVNIMSRNDPTEFQDTDMTIPMADAVSKEMGSNVTQADVNKFIKKMK